MIALASSHRAARSPRRWRRSTCPIAGPLLVKAIKHAVFPGGGRFRPRLCLAVAMACGDDAPELAERAASAIELLHCASLVHDDLPCFDDAALRRGLPSVHAAYGAPLAVLAGDALIVQAFGIFSTPASTAPERMPALQGIIARASWGASWDIRRQAWESEPHPDLGAYHRAKTAALFAAAAEAVLARRAMRMRLGGPSASASARPIRWAMTCVTRFRLKSVIGKPVGRDRALSRPSAVASLGVAGAVAHLRGLIERATGSIPDVPAASALRAIIEAEAARFVPKELRQAA